MRVWFSFGNHMHWNDMEWMWGPGTLANSLEDMFRFIDRTGSKGAINFDALGYRYLASNRPDLIQALRERIKKGEIEIASGSHSQPYGHLCGEEANFQQFLMGIGICKQTLGQSPSFWWEEEFMFFPQLPQILRSFGYTGACLFFQETWHTPVIPLESIPAILWEGIDGTLIPTLAYTENCIHQWPEHLEALFERNSPNRVFLQWLELMDSPKWMCRSELIAPVIAEWRARGIELDYQLPSTLLDGLKPTEKRKYQMADLFQGISLGKNGDQIRRDSRYAEILLLDGQIMALCQMVVGSDYPQWSFYPEWEFQQGWDDLMVAQAHDMDECEGFCGDIGKQYLQKAISLGSSIVDRYLNVFARETGKEGDWVVFNPLHHERLEHILLPNGKWEGFRIPEGPGMVIPQVIDPPRLHLTPMDDGFRIGDRFGHLYRIFPDGTIKIANHTLHQLISNGQLPEAIRPLECEQHSESRISLRGRIMVDRYNCSLSMVFDSLSPFIQMECIVNAPEDPLPGYRGALFCRMDSADPLRMIRSDFPFGQEEGWPKLNASRKYPKGDWMTSEKFHETIVTPFTGLRYAQAIHPSSSLCFLGRGTQGFFRRDNGFQASLFLYDPWDGSNWLRKVTIPYGLALLGGEEQPERMAQEYNRPLRWIRSSGHGNAESLHPFRLKGTVFLASAQWRDDRILIRVWNQFDSREPFSLEFPFSILRAAITTPFGSPIRYLNVEKSFVNHTLGPHEILTLSVWIERDPEGSLDKYRHVWSSKSKSEE